MCDESTKIAAGIVFIQHEIAGDDQKQWHADLAERLDELREHAQGDTGTLSTDAQRKRDRLGKRMDTDDA